MEHKKRKMFAAVIVMMLCAVAIIGVGYAYTAQTKNAGNDVDTEYITLFQDGTGKYTFASNTNVEWNTSDYMVDEQPKTDFWLNGITPTEIGETPVSYDLVQLGNSFTVGAKQTGGTPPATLTCTVVAKGFTFQSNVDLFVKVVATKSSGSETTFMKLTGNNAFDTSTFSIYLNSGSDYYTASVSVLYGYLSDPGYVTVNHDPGVAAVGPNGSPIDNGSLSFSVKAGSDKPVIGVSLTNANLSLSSEGKSVTLTPTFDPADATTQKVMWSIVSTTGHLSIDNNGKVTASNEAAVDETATVTVTTLDGRFTATCTVTVVA